MKKKNDLLKKVLFSSMYLCLVALLSYCLAINIKTSINEINTWQHYASYDFETIIEKDNDGNEHVVYGISNGAQLAGAMMLDNSARLIIDDVNTVSGGTTKLGGISSVTKSGGNTIVNNDTGSTSSQKSITSYFNGNYVLTCNIDLGKYNWEPVDFSGTFDGHSYVIKNLNCTKLVKTVSGYSSAGFIANLTSGSKLINVYFESINVTNATTSSAYKSTVTGVVGYNSGTIENVNVISGNIKGNGYNSGYNAYVGGIAGYNYGTITNCSNSSKVCQGTYVGGITGSSSYTITSCFNSGYVYTGTYNTSTYAGGIAGYLYGASVCVNSGNVSAYTKGSSNVCYAGGIAGRSGTSINKCQNNGSICSGGASEAEKSYAGGIVGYCSSSISNSINKGSVSGYAKVTSTSPTTTNTSTEVLFADGVGLFWAYKIYMISGSKNYTGSGPYSGTKYNSTYYYTGRYAYVGGIVGYAYSVSNCYSIGSINTSYDRGIYKVYDLYFKWKANSEYRLLLHNVVKFGIDDYCGPIVGYSSGSVSYCAYSTSCSTVNYSFYYTQRAENNGSYQDVTLSGWKKHYEGDWRKNNHDDGWYVEDLNGAAFNTYHSVDATSCSSIKLTAHYTSQYLSKDLKTYYTINTGLSSTTKSEKGTSESNSRIKAGYGINTSSGFKTGDSSKNDGYPYIEGLYW